MIGIGKMVFFALVTTLLGSRLNPDRLNVYGHNANLIARITFDPPVKVYNGTTVPRPVNHSIQRRSIYPLRMPPCKIPPLFDTQLDCFESKYRLTCNQTCVWGHTFLDGVIEHKMSCVFNEDMWTAPFERCWPFVDCTIHEIVSNKDGIVQCWDNYMDKGPECQLKCADNPLDSALPPTIYKCDRNNRWEPELPECFAQGPAYNLVPPPKGRKFISESLVQKKKKKQTLKLKSRTSLETGLDTMTFTEDVLNVKK